MTKTNQTKLHKIIKRTLLVLAWTFIAYFTYVISYNVLLAFLPKPVAPVVAPVMTKPTIDNLLAGINAERAKVGVAPLKLDERLNKSAQIKADDMENRDYFGHVDPDGKRGLDIIRDNMPNACTTVSENLLDNNDASNDDIVRSIQGWVGSPAHYRGLTNPNYDITGFGISGYNIVEHFCDLK